MQQVADWLEKLGLGQYAQRFAENDISFVILPDLTDQDLEKTGVASLGHRRLLLRAIAELKTPTSDTAALAPSASAKIDAAERRHVTVMFSDLVGSTALSARMDAEDLREIISARLSAAAGCGRFRTRCASRCAPTRSRDPESQPRRVSFAISVTQASLKSPRRFRPRVTTQRAVRAVRPKRGRGTHHARPICRRRNGKTACPTESGSSANGQ